MIHLKEFGMVYRSRMSVEVHKFISKNLGSKNILRLRFELMNFINIMMNSNKLTYERPISVNLRLDEDTIVIKLVQGISSRNDYIGCIKIKTL